MRGRYLEVTFRNGRPLTAYLYLPWPAGAHSTRTEEVDCGLLADYDAAGTLIGLEITAPGRVSVEQINSTLDRLGQPRISPDEVAPLRTA